MGSLVYCWSRGSELVRFCQHTWLSQGGLAPPKSIYSCSLSPLIKRSHRFKASCLFCQCEIAMETYMLYFQIENIFCCYKIQFHSCIIHHLINHKWLNLWLNSSFVGTTLDLPFISIFEKITF